jgi:hypothetical protein
LPTTSASSYCLGISVRRQFKTASVVSYMAFHMTLLVLGVLAMSLGSFLKVRLYVLLGLAGVATDLASILYKVLMHMDRSSRMTLVGTQVLLLGALLIGGAVVYKTHQEKLNETMELWRRRLTSWE